jgi:predicted amidophosphoribosyltransferase
VGDEETFECPSCGCMVPPQSMECPECLEQFGVLEEQPCPFCGKPMEEGELCPCGAMVADICPECGSKLGSLEMSCDNCGAAFEFL